MDKKQYLHEVGQNLADLFYNQKNINMKQTAVEWLEQQLYKAGWEQLTHEEKMNICCTAKMMEKEQIAQSFEDGEYNYFYSKKDGKNFENGFEYYNEKFKQQKQ
jgi:hypothetical protein